MYTELKSYQIIIAMLKKYGIKHCVLSAGARNVPFVHSVEEDPYFQCYSVVDERSAGYFAMGLAQQLNEPVVISCTSSTAACNYWPPVAEAFYQNVPLVVLTSDRDPQMLGQREDQMIDQVGMFDRHVKKSVNLPVVKDDDDFRYCNRLINEAFLELEHNGGGPVHINIPMKWYSTSYPEKTLPNVVKIEKFTYESSKEIWRDSIDKLSRSKRIMVVCGQMSKIPDSMLKQMEMFFHRFNCTFCVEYMSNVDFEGSINTFVCMESKFITQKKFAEFLPDIVISYGGNIMSGLKSMLRATAGKYEHWLIQEDGAVCDIFNSMTKIFECSPEYFFKQCNYIVSDGKHNDLIYHKLLSEYAESVRYPDFQYSNIYAIKNVVEKIPEGSILHLSINNAIRITNFFTLKDQVKVYANIGTYGIDGCLSSFLGQAISSDKLCYLVIGDLAFFYDMNALRIKHKKNNIRILLINNRGGEEFYYNGTWKNENSDLHTSARHSTDAKGWGESCGFKYISAKDKESYDMTLQSFMSYESEKPILFEVFTEMSTDSKAIFDFYNYSRPRDVQSEVIKKGKQIVKSTIGKEKAIKMAEKLGVKLK